VSTGVTSEMPVLSASAFGDPYCAHCGTELHDDQEWCLECGAARTLIHRPPDWRIPVAIAATILLLVLAGFAIALTNLSKHTNATTASTPAAAAAPTAIPAPTAPAGQTAPATTAPKPIGSWPVGLSGWTVVLFTSHAKASADGRAAGLIAGGLRVGELNSSQHPNLRPGYWVVFAGRYPHGTEAAAAAARLRDSGHPTAQARQVARPGGL
jgi:SPOR domain